MTSPSVSISVFGSTRAQIDGHRVNLGSRGQRAVLARLVAAGPRVVGTDELIDDLWAGAPPPRALGALQVNISNLRKVLEPGRAPRAHAHIVVSTPPGYTLELPPEAVDVWTFEKLLADAATTEDVRQRSTVLSQALNMWQEWPFAEVLDTVWATASSDRLLELRRSAYEERGRNLLELGEPAQVIVDMETLVKHVPHREEGVRLLALALYRSGRQADALAALRRCRTFLSSDMGIDPGPALRELEQSILSQHVELNSRPASPSGPQDTVTLRATEETRTVNGRPEELRTLLRAADRAAGCEFTVVWVSGEAGEGKSTLAAILGTTLAHDSWSVASGHCPEVDGAPPGWAWTEALDTLTTAHPMDEQTVSRLGPVLHVGGRPSDDASATPFWLGRWIGDYLGAIAASTPVLLVLDDVHRADALTLGILRQLANELAGQRVLIVATYRNSEVDEELTTTWTTMTDAYTSWIQLRGIDESRIARLAEQFGLTDPTPAVVRMLAERTGGNPLFVRELARLIASEGVGAARDGVPLGISDVLRRRLSTLPERTSIVLRWAAVLGRDIDLLTLSAISDVDEEHLLDDLEPAVRAGLLSEPGGDRLRFTHALVRDTLYFDLPRLRRTRAHARVVRFLEESSPGDQAALAFHAEHGATASTGLRSAQHIVAAARQAEAMSAHTEALALWNSALRTLEVAPNAPDRQRLALLIPLVGSHARAGNTLDARRRRQQAIDLARSAGDTRDLVDAVTAWHAPVIWHIRDAEPDRGILDPIDALLRDESVAPSDRVRVLVARFFEVEGLDATASAQSALEAVELAEELEDPRLLCSALNAFGYLAYGPDHPSERVTRARQLLAVASSSGLVEYQALAHYQLFLAANAVCDLVGARTHVHAAIRLASGSALTQLLGVLTMYGALIDVLAGRYEFASAKYAAISASMNELSEWHGDETSAMGKLSIACATGDFTDVAEALTELDEHLPVNMRNAVVLALAEVGDFESARALWRTTGPHPRDYLWRGMTALRARAAVLLGDQDVCRECYAALLPFHGTLAGVDSGSMFAGVVDDILATLAEALGRDTAAAEHRLGAARVRTDIAAQLTDTGWADSR